MVSIKLCSNYQQIEITGETYEEVTNNLGEYVRLINNLGSTVINTTQNKGQTPPKQIEYATPRQVEVLVKMGIPEYEAKAMSKKAAWEFINGD